MLEKEITCLLGDFGLSCVGGSRHREKSGTPGYQPPEQQYGGDQNARSDVFALAMIVADLV